MFRRCDLRKYRHLREILLFARDIVVCARYRQLLLVLVYLYTLSFLANNYVTFQVKFVGCAKYLLPNELGISNEGFVPIPVLLIVGDRESFTQR